MVGAVEERRFFEACKAELLKSFPGHFAVICGRRLVGVYTTLDLALGAMSDDFDGCNLPAGATIFITQIADEVSLRVVAQRRDRPTRAAVT